MEYPETVRIITDVLKEFDSERPVHKDFRPGIGPFGEPQIVREIANRLAERGISSQTKRTPDLEVQHEFAIKFKIVRPFGDNGREAENWSVNLLHPYDGNVSLIGDALKLLRLPSYPHRGLFVIGYEHDPPRLSLDPLINSFELIAKHVLAALRRRHPLGCAVLAGSRAAEEKPDPQAEGYRKGHPSPDAQHEEYVSLVTEEFPSLNPALNQCQVVSTLLPSIA